MSLYEKLYRLHYWLEENSYNVQLILTLAFAINLVFFIIISMPFEKNGFIEQVLVTLLMSLIFTIFTALPFVIVYIVLIYLLIFILYIVLHTIEEINPNDEIIEIIKKVNKEKKEKQIVYNFDEETIKNYKKRRITSLATILAIFIGIDWLFGSDD